MTFGAFGGRRDGGVMSMFDPRNGILSHSGTFNNNIVTMAAGCAGIDIYTEGEATRLNTLGEKLKASVEKILQKHGITGPMKEVRCPKKNELESPFTGAQASSPQTGISVESLSLSENEKGNVGMWISGQGSMLNIHFSGESEKSLRGLFWHHMLENGIYMAQRGFIVLNLELTEMHMEKVIRAVEGFVVKYKGALSS